ncbi:MAG: hypothetical protein WA710_15660, partial [Pseudolabrys sp.]
ATTTTSERIDHWTKMRRSLAKFSESEASNHTPSSADFMTITPVFKFSAHTGESENFADSLPWLSGRGSADTLPWAARHLD